MRFNTLNDWLSWQESLHPSEIDLGLARVRAVYERMGVTLNCPVITVAGTNGKGSSVAMLAAIYRAAGYRVGVYTSPHLLRYNERICIDGEEVSDEALCHSFERIDQARGETSITYFEFGTLAAFDLFGRAALDVVILEVGLGGRLDAVNIVDADVALIATIAIDHVAWLGNDRETIGREKAGIMRAGRPAVCGDLNPPQSIVQVAQELGVTLYLNGRDFGAKSQPEQWRWWSSQRQRDALPMPALRGSFQLHNAAAVLMVVELLSERLPIAQAHIREGLANVKVAGRFQVIGGDTPLVFDVAHNPESAQALASTLNAWPMPGRIFAVTAMMADKDIAGALQPLLKVIDEWHVTAIDMARSATAERMQQELQSLGVTNVHCEATVITALEAVKTKAQPNDRIVVFGSFYTVAEAIRAAYN
jgi:dihydrofolate synthase/folylpolyglutamate synthase